MGIHSNLVLCLNYDPSVGDEALFEAHRSWDAQYGGPSRISHVPHNNLSKITPDVIRLWSRVLHAVPRSRLLLKWKTLAQTAQRERIMDAFVREGIARDRLELRGASPMEQLFVEYADMDIALDPFPFSGGMTSLDTLWMGVPIITMCGTRPVSRQTHGMLAVLGLGDLSCTAPEAYVAAAVRLAKDLDALSALREGLRAKMASSPLLDAPTFARNLEAAYRTMWRAYCGRNRQP